jgi:hypothetical protein
MQVAISIAFLARGSDQLGQSDALDGGERNSPECVGCSSVAFAVPRAGWLERNAAAAIRKACAARFAAVNKTDKISLWLVKLRERVGWQKAIVAMATRTPVGRAHAELR